MVRRPIFVDRIVQSSETSDGNDHTWESDRGVELHKDNRQTTAGDDGRRT